MREGSKKGQKTQSYTNSLVESSRWYDVMTSESSEIPLDWPWRSREILEVPFPSIGYPHYPCITKQKSQRIKPWIFMRKFSLVFLGPHPKHMETPRLGVELELQLPAPAQPQQCQIPAASVTYTTAHRTIDPLTHWVRPGIELASSQILVRLITTEPQQELPEKIFESFCKFKGIRYNSLSSSGCML